MSELKQKQVIAGIDDATKCPCIGSLFVSGVTATPHMIRKWKSMGVKDSKLIARPKREKLAKIIMDTAVSYQIAEVTPGQMADTSLNLNDWEMLTALSIIDRLKGNMLKIYIDNWEVSKAHFFRRMEILIREGSQKLIIEKGFELDCLRLKNLRLIPKHRADELHVIVGAASILSKVSSDAQYDVYRRQYGDFGSGSPGDPKTRHFIWKHRHDPLPIIRITWRTYKDISRLKRIEDDRICGRAKNKSLEP
jgi:ribonuclease HII